MLTEIVFQRHGERGVSTRSRHGFEFQGIVPGAFGGHQKGNF